MSESDEADLIRDEMDWPWYAMTKTERELMSRLSDTLLAISEQRTDSLDSNFTICSQTQNLAKSWQDDGFPEVAFFLLHSNNL